MSFDIFLKKEMTELVKSVKGIVLAVVFLFIAVSAPLITKLTPEIVNWAMSGMSEAESAEMDMLMRIMPEPDSVQSYSQFFGNFNMIGLFALIIVFGGIVANEKSKGTAAYILTKNISRTEFILSKFVSSVLFIFVSTVLTGGVLKIYTDLLFKDGLIENKDFIIYCAILFLYLVFIMSIVLFASILSKNVTSATIMGFLIFIGFNIWAAVPRFGKYAPPNINDFSVLLNLKDSADLTAGIIVTAVLSVLFLISGIYLFNKQEL